MRNNRVFKQKLVKWIRPRRQDGLVARAFITRISNNHNSGHLIKKADTYNVYAAQTQIIKQK